MVACCLAVPVIMVASSLSISQIISTSSAGGPHPRRPFSLMSGESRSAGWCGIMAGACLAPPHKRGPSKLMRAHRSKRHQHTNSFTRAQGVHQQNYNMYGSSTKFPVCPFETTRRAGVKIGLVWGKKGLSQAGPAGFWARRGACRFQVP